MGRRSERVNAPPYAAQGAVFVKACVCAQRTVLPAHGTIYSKIRAASLQSRDPARLNADTRLVEEMDPMAPRGAVAPDLRLW